MVALCCHLVLDICIFYDILWRIGDKDALVSFADFRIQMEQFENCPGLNNGQSAPNKVQSF